MDEAIGIVPQLDPEGLLAATFCELDGYMSPEDVVHWYETERGSDVSRVSSVVLVRVEQAAALVSPAYADGSSEATIEQRSLDMYGLKRR